MKTQNMQDERVAAQRRKISDEAYGILMIALLVSVLVQQFLLNAPFEQYAAELLCLIGISLYMIVRYLTLGLNLFGEGKRAKKIPLVNSVVAGTIVTAINGVLNYSRYADHYREDGIGYFIAAMAFVFFSATVIAFVFLWGVGYLNQKRQAKIQKRLDEEEQDG